MSSIAALSMAYWPMPRKVAAALFGIVCIVGLACAAIYLSAVLFLLLNKADPRQANFGSIAHYWALYADDPRLRKTLFGSMVVSGVGLLIVLPAALIAAARPRRALHGDARFASAAEIERAALTGNAGGSPSILVGRYSKRFLALPGQLSVMLSAPTRSGKGVGVVIPNLLNWPDSVVVLDIKGENFDVTAGYRAAHGQAVFGGDGVLHGGRSCESGPVPRLFRQLPDRMPVCKVVRTYYHRGHSTDQPRPLVGRHTAPWNCSRCGRTGPSPAS